MLLVLTLTALCSWSEEALAAAKYSRASAGWSTNSTWSTAGCGGAANTTAPGAADDATICTGHDITTSANSSALSLTIQAGGTLTQATNRSLTIGAGGLDVAGDLTSRNTLTVNGTTTISGTLNITSTGGTKTLTGGVTIAPTGTLQSTVAETVTIGGNSTNNGTVNTTGTLAIGAGVTFTNNSTVTATRTITGANATTSIWVNAAGSMLNYANSGSTTGPMATGVLTADASGNTVNYSRAGNQTIKLPSAGYHHLTLSTSGTKTAPAGTLAILGNLAVNASATLTANSNDPTINVAGDVTIDGTYTASSNAARPLTIAGNMSVGGTYTGNAAPVNLAGNFTDTGTFTSSTGIFTFNGTSLQTLTGASTFTNMVVNNTGSGLQLASDITASSNATTGSLTLTAGVVATGGNTLIVPRNCNTAGLSRTGGWVAGNLRLQFPTGTPSCTFHVGDASAYRPIDMVFASVTTAGSLTGTVSQSAGDHGNIASSLLDAAKSVNRYWTLTNPAAGIVFTTYTATFNFINPGDFDVGATPTSFEIERWDGAAWNNTTLSAAGATSTTASGLPSISAGASDDFAMGEKKGPYVVSIALASTDPTSPGTLVDWTVTFSASVTGVDTTDFALVPGGSVTGAAITGVTGSGTTWTVTAGTGAGAGTLGLDLVDDDTITNGAGKPLGGTGTGNGDFTGAVYTVEYTAAGFVFTDSVCTSGVAFGAGQPCALFTWPLQVAGQNLTGIYITVVNASGVPTRLHASQSRDRNMEFGLSCVDPSTHANRQATFAGATLPLCEANGAIPTAWSSPVTVVTFPGGSPSSQVSYTFNYPDVGSVKLFMRNNATPSETGTSGAFVVKPGGFTLSAIQQTAAPNLANPGAADANGTSFVKAGEAFSVTVTATTIDGLTAAPNYGQETVAEGAKLNLVLLAPSGGAAPALQNASAFGSFSVGVASGTTFAWDEVGIITLTPSVGDGNYLGAGDVSGTTTGNVGRFYPDHLETAVTSAMSCGALAFVPACPTGSYLVYSGQGFTTQVTAYTLGGTGVAGITTNYSATESFSKAVTLTAWDALGSTTQQNPPASGGSLTGNSIAAASFAAGAASASPVYTFTATPTAPTNVYFRAIDTDSVSTLNTIPANSVEGGAKFVNGRLQVENMYGPPPSRLGTKARALYWSGTQWALNTSDTASGAATGNFALGDSGTCVTPIFCGITLLSAALLGTGGEFRLVLTPPTSGSDRRSVLLNSTVTYLTGSGRQTWGSFRAPYIHQQER
ncbi:MAG: DUF6701 domain-containing protein [Sulfuritalea sp.]|nr:DUF6701 domain-containing protein [Sulfuritalea sp.]